MGILAVQKLRSHMRAAAIAELFAPELAGAFGKTLGGQPASLILLLCAQRRVLLCAQQVF